MAPGHQAVFWHQCVVAVDHDTLSSFDGQLEALDAQFITRCLKNRTYARNAMHGWMHASMHGPVALSHEATFLNQAASPNGQSKHVWMSFHGGAHKACSKAPHPSNNPNTPPATQPPVQQSKHPSSNPNTPPATHPPHQQPKHRSGGLASQKSVRVIVGSNWS